MFPAKQINALVGQSAWNHTATLPLTGSTLDVSLAFVGKTAGGNDDVSGVFTEAPDNKIAIRRLSNGKSFIATPLSGAKVFARLTHASSVWTLTFYTLSEGAESAFDWEDHADAGAAFEYLWAEAVQLKDVAPTAIAKGADLPDDAQPASPLLHTHPDPDTLTVDTNGQTVFALAATPKFSQCQLFVNGQIQAFGAGKDFTVFGSTLTWLDRYFTLSTTDEVVAIYEV